MTNLINYNLIKKTGIIFYKNNKTIRKFARSNNSLKLLRNDLKGYNWFKSILKSKNIILKDCKIKNTYIDYPFHAGRNICYWNSLEENYNNALRIVKFYEEYWPKKKITACHGDLTFSNIIFNKKDEPMIIDWENFSNKEFWGIDICYFLISTVALPAIVKNEKRIGEKDLQLFEKLWKNFYLNKKIHYLKNPILYLKKRFKKNFKYRNFNDYYLNNLNIFLQKQINEIIKK